MLRFLSIFLCALSLALSGCVSDEGELPEESGGGSGGGNGGGGGLYPAPPPSLPYLSISDASANESDGMITFTVSLSHASKTSTTFKWSTGNGTAKGGEDFTAVSSKSASIYAGQTSTTLKVALVDDSNHESDELFTVVLSNVTGATLLAPVGIGTIADNDAPPLPSLSIADVTVSEASGTATLTVTLNSSSTSPVTFNWATNDGTATAGEDYTEVSETPATIAVGQTTKTLTISIDNDTKYEPNENFTVTLSDLNGATLADGSAIVTIMDDDSPPSVEFSSASQTVNEGDGTVTVSVVQSAESGFQTTIPFTVSGTATGAGADHDLASGTITIPAGSTIGETTFTIMDDASTESDETVILTMTPLSVGIHRATAGAQTTHTVTIIDDDVPLPTLSIADTTVTEGGTATFTVSLDQASSQDVTFKYKANSGGTAIPGTDYTSIALSDATITAGETTTTLTIPTTQDSLHEADETFHAIISNANGATISDDTAIGTIENDDEAPTISIAATNASEGSGGGTTDFTFTITASEVSGLPIVVDHATADGTATTSDDDYTSTTGTLTIPAGATTATISVPVSADSKHESDETFSVTLSGGFGYTSAGSDLSALGTIDNDDSAPTIRFSSASQTVDESIGSVTVTIELSTVSGLDATVTWTRSGTAANPADMDLPASGTVTISTGDTSTNVTFSVVDDTSDESDETVTLTLSSPSGATLGATTAHTVTITDNDLPPPLVVGPLYSGNGDWNSYVRNNGTTHYDASNTACNGTETGATLTASCIHGGEKLKVEVPQFSNCSGKTMEDNLGVFDWVCDGSTNPVNFYSVGLKPGKGLKDLVNATSWKNNYVIAKDGSTIASQSEPEAWWSNTVQALPLNSGAGSGQTLSSAGTIYTISADQNTAGNRITADRVAVVTFAGATLRWNNTVNGYCQPGDTSNGANCVLAVSNAKFAWIEGNFSGASGTGANRAAQVLAFSSMTFSRLHQVRANYTNTSSAGSHAIVMDGSHRNLLTNIQAAPFSTQGAGVYAWGCSNNVFHDLRLSNGFSGISIDDASSSKNVITRAFVIATNKGIELTTNTGSNTVTHITTAFNDESGIKLNSAGASNTIMNVAAFNNAIGILVSSTSSILFTNLMSTHADRGVSLTSSSSNAFRGWLSVGNNSSSNCYVSGGTNPGITNSTCAQQGSSSITVNTGISLASSFAGAITSDETSNASDSNGSATLGATLDFLNFANPWRLWAKSSSTTATASSLRGLASTGVLQVWDWSLAPADAVARNKSGTGASTANSAFTNGAACPSLLNGSQANAGADGQTYLIHAMEIIGDSKGDDDGLCESNEDCVYTPNVGAYQGYGDYGSSTCTFTDGTITGARIFSYPSN